MATGEDAKGWADPESDPLCDFERSVEVAPLTFYEDVPCDHRETATRSASVVDDDGRPITTATLTVCVKCGRPVAGQITGAPLPPSA